MACDLYAFAKSLAQDEQLCARRIFILAFASESHMIRHSMLALAALRSRYHAINSSKQTSEYVSIAGVQCEISAKDSQEQPRELDPSKVESILRISRLPCILGLGLYPHSLSQWFHFEE